MGSSALTLTVGEQALPLPKKTSVVAIIKVLFLRFMVLIPVSAVYYLIICKNR